MPDPILQDAPEIRLIVSDLDGTLLNSQHALSPRTQAAIEAAVAQGVSFVLATGKTRYSAQALIKTLALTTPGVYVQGVVTYNADGSIRAQQTLDTALVRRILTYTQERAFEVLVYSGTQIFARRKSAASDLVARYGEPEAAITPDLYQKLPQISINKLCIAGDESRIRALRWQLEKQYPGQIAVTRAGVEGMLEVLPPGVSKGRGVRALIQDLKIDPQHVMALGDGENDLEMLKVVGWPVAVGNAHQSLKDVAKYIAPTNDDEGVAEAIERFVLKTTAKPAAAETPADTILVQADAAPAAVSEAVEKAAAADLPVVLAVETLAVPPLDETPKTE